MKRALLFLSAVTTVLAAPVLLSGCATTSATASADKGNPAQMLGSQQMARAAMEQQQRSVEKAGRSAGPVSRSK
ncbi:MULTISPECIES: hypothetical protein [Asticcacaulis]|uniref:hypothetical protein n=1 Tax=Asticcacaulis TaxID=76890 RepID=UPI001AE61A0C|nr:MULTISPECIES: hypothetical protein [Asticcacaulis]MBP2160157.1 uncharacterized protein YceK [Asticcacaulis solisilvae]MDR6801202.1 uncharacterized protein YceK [Asticcacaulis sp. BE141]